MLPTPDADLSVDRLSADGPAEDDPAGDDAPGDGSDVAGSDADLVVEDLTIRVPTETRSHRRRARAKDVLARLVTGPSRATPTRHLDPIDQHRAEYREPSIWVWRRIVGTAFAFIAVTVGWYLLKVPDGLVVDQTLPTQSQVASAFNEMRSDGFAGARLVDHAAASLARLVIGTLIGASVGAVIGIAVGSAPLVRTVVDPVTSLLGMVPAMAIGPLAIVWLGAGEAGIVGAVAATVLWVSVDVVSTVRVRDLRAMRPDIAHELTTGIRRALAAGWAAVLAIETLLAPVGLGPMLWTAQNRVDVMVAGIYVVGLIGLTIDLVPRSIEYLVVNGAPTDRGAVRARHPAGRSIGFRDGSAVRSG